MTGPAAASFRFRYLNFGERKDSSTTATWTRSYATATGSNRLHHVTQPV